MGVKDELFFIGTTRFTNQTWGENVLWRERHRWKGCIYALNKKLPVRISPMALVFVIEMNNDENKIMGIGLIRNFMNKTRKTCVHRNDTNYNRYIYNSMYRIDRRDIKNSKMLLALEELLFRGKGHYKRSQGITTIGWEKFKGAKTKRIVKHFFEGLFNFK